MTPEQRAKINHILQHQDGLDGEYLDLVMTDLDSLTAEIATLKREKIDCLKKAYDQEVTIISLKAQVEHYKLQSDQLCDRVEVLATENATLKGEVERLRANDNWDGEKCREGCGRNQRAAWSVTDKVWGDVTGGLKNVLCLECFLKLCEDKGYELRVTDFQFLSIGGARLIDSSVIPDYATLKGEVERLQMIALCGDKSHLLVIRERDTLRTRLAALVTAAEAIVEEYTGEYTYYSVSSAKLIQLRNALSAAVNEAKGGKDSCGRT